MSHLKRWITGTVAVPLLIIMIAPGPDNRPVSLIFYLFLYVLNVIGLAEFHKMVSPALPRTVKWSGYVLTFFLFAVVYCRQILITPVVVILFALVPMTFFIFASVSPRAEVTSWVGKATMGPIYLSLPLVTLMHLHRFYPNGSLWIFFLLAVVFAGDTGAFYAGTWMGRHKLHEKISPGKTWEGAFGGLFSSLVAAAVFLNFFRLQVFDASAFALALLLSAGAQLGDLAESLIKRSHGVKDSGAILPGHGGLLDRIDGLLFGIPILYSYLYLRLP